ncbi:MAG: O-antigen ligase family protein [Candidatus Saccharibacteria bacterium]
MIRLSQLSVIEKIYLGILLVIFGGIVLHAPLTTGLGALVPDYSLVFKMWKEFLLFVATVAAGMILYQKRSLHILKEPLMVGIEIYAALHLLLLALFWQGLAPAMAGLMIDLRYVLFFVLVYLALRLYPTSRRLFIKVGVIGALVALIFALLQVFVLPKDILKYIGYGPSTIVPYLTVDQNSAFIRITGTFRGPNPLGAYAAVVLILLAAFATRHRINVTKYRLAIVGILSLGGVVALWASYSRSALIGTLVGLGIVLVATVGRRLPRRSWIIGSVVLVAIVGGLVLSRGGNFISNVVLHENPGQGNSINSDQGHVESLQNGFGNLVKQPLGGGIGSTGSASLYGQSPLIIENQYLLIAHETGWLGLILFLMIFVGILNRLWQRRQDYLALGVFASGIGLALIGLLLPVWVDDSVAIIWWGLAAIAIGTQYD